MNLSNGMLSQTNIFHLMKNCHISFTLIVQAVEVNPLVVICQCIPMESLCCVGCPLSLLSSVLFRFFCHLLKDFLESFQLVGAIEGMLALIWFPIISHLEKKNSA